MAGTLFWDAAQRAFRKIRASLGAEALKYIERFRPAFHHTTFGTSDYSQQAELIDQVMIGIEDRRAVILTYRSQRTTESVSYDIYPYGLTYHRGSLYVIGWAPRREQIRHWKVNRIENAEVTNLHFPRPDGFDLQNHLANSFGTYHGQGDIHVTIRFSATVARYVQEKTWHPSQNLTNQPDGSLLAKFRLSNTEEIKRWVLGFGKEAKVVGPEELRKEVVEESEAVLDNYLPIRDANKPRSASRAH